MFGLWMELDIYYISLLNEKYVFPGIITSLMSSLEYLTISVLNQLSGFIVENISQKFCKIFIYNIIKNVVYAKLCYLL